VLAEPIQIIMRKHGLALPYEQLKALTRGESINKTTLHQFIDTLALPEDEKLNLKALSPESYLGCASSLAKKV